MSRQQPGADEHVPAVLLDELRHRLRNHLQNMTSLIGLQIKRAQHPETVMALEDLRARFTTLTSIYVDLDGDADNTVALEQFLPDLMQRVAELYDPHRRHYVETALTPVTLGGRRAAVLGQIVVELVINVYRHAFAGRSGGTIRATLAVEGGDAVLTLADDGPGLTDADPSRKHLGFSIIGSLAKSLGGGFEHESRGGFVARVRFPADA